MTTFRFSAAFGFALVVAGCTQENMPPRKTELGQIARMSGIDETQRALRQYAESRLSKPNDLRQEFARAGFRRFIDGNCEIFRWEGRGWGSIYDKVMIVSICDRRVEGIAGYIGL